MRSNGSIGRRGWPLHALAPLATGWYLVLAGVVVYAPFLISPYAVQNDVFMPNYFLAPVFVVVGLPFLIVGALGARRQARIWGEAALLGFVSAGIFTLVYWLFGGRYYHYGETVSSEPPYLNGSVGLVSIALVVVTFVVAWVWSSREAATPPPRTS